jgi:predicted TIM-barrel fold metal-dependent hydrolase
MPDSLLSLSESEAVMSDTADQAIAIDADGHVHEADEMFTEYLDPAFRDRTRGWALNDDGNRRLFVDGAQHPPFPPEISVRKPMTAENRLRVLDKERIGAAVLFPSATLVASYLEPGFAAAMSVAHNNWISDYVHPHRDRLYFAAPLALYDVGHAVAEARRAVGDLGAVAVTIRPNPVAGRTLDDPAYNPLYAAVQELGVPLCVHESTGCMETAGGDRYGGMMDPASYAFNHVISHPFEQMFAMMSLLCGGVLERFPDLRIAFLEAGCSWVPYWLARLDDHFEHRKLGRYMPNLSMRPSEYFHRQCIVSCDPGDPTIPLAVAGLGAERIVFATDYPHFDSGGGAVSAFLSCDGLDPACHGKILRDNAMEFYGFAESAAASAA